MENDTTNQTQTTKSQEMKNMFAERDANDYLKGFALNIKCHVI